MTAIAPQQPIQSLVACYAGTVLSKRYRLVTLRGRKCDARIMLTLLGFEVKAGRKRISCPDKATARYLRLFAEIGMKQIRIPYDPTVTARAIPKLESALKDLNQSVRAQSASEVDEKRLVRRAYRELRTALTRAEQESLAQG